MTTTYPNATEIGPTMGSLFDMIQRLYANGVLTEKQQIAAHAKASELFDILMPSATPAAPTRAEAGDVALVTCDRCGGRGSFSCSQCNGTGKQQSLYHGEEFECGICDGTARVDCYNCKGTGKVTVPAEPPAADTATAQGGDDGARGIDDQKGDAGYSHCVHCNRSTVQVFDGKDWVCEVCDWSCTQPSAAPVKATGVRTLGKSLGWDDLRRDDIVWNEQWKQVLRITRVNRRKNGEITLSVEALTSGEYLEIGKRTVIDHGALYQPTTQELMAVNATRKSMSRR